MYSSQGWQMQLVYTGFGFLILRYEDYDFMDKHVVIPPRIESHKITNEIVQTLKVLESAKKNRRIDGNER